MSTIARRSDTAGPWFVGLDGQGDLAPPWERFPTYERYTIGWRMGSGETWQGMWGAFLNQLGPAHEARLAYLRRLLPAPIS